MAVGENEVGNAYNYFGAELEYHINTGMGEGNYRATLVNTSADFEDPAGQGGKRHNGIIFSFDQQLGQSNMKTSHRVAWISMVDYGAARMTTSVLGLLMSTAAIWKWSILWLPRRIIGTWSPALSRLRWIYNI